VRFGEVVNDIRNATAPSFGEVVHEVQEAISGSTGDFWHDAARAAKDIADAGSHEADVFSAAGEIPESLYEKLKDLL
jgi:hypothetical protein